MTDDDLPTMRFERGLEVVATVLSLALVALGLGFEAMSAIPPVAHEYTDAFTRGCDLTCISAITLLAGYALLLEWLNRHSTNARRFWRRGGWCAQALLIAICVADIIGQRKYIELAWIVSVIFMAMGAWSAWMRTQMLPPDDQKVIDELIAEKERRETDAIRAAEHRRREARFQQIAARYQVGDAKAVRRPAAPQPLAQPYAWTIPDGKHRPLVYFVQNGDRVKIGTTTNLRNRISNLSLRPTDIVLLLSGGRPYEQSLHRRFAEQRVGNTEWFQCAGPVVEFIATETARMRANDKKEG